jgi:glycosyltransferase involved in cell wall biosynthesis
LALGIGLSAEWLGNQEPGAWSELEADVLVHPTLDETFGMVVYEALHRGLPVLASDIPAFRPWLLPPFGLLVAEGPEAFADALEQFWMNPFAVPQDGFDFKRFEAQEVGKQLQKIYAGLLTKNGF